MERSIATLLKDAVKGKMPERVRPMLCTLITEFKNDPGYLYEIKWDGYRILSYVQNGKVRLDSRSGKDYTPKYPLVAKALKALKINAVIDGEMVVFDDQGHPSFNGVQLYNGHNTPIYYYVFDILWLGGYDLRELPLTKRKEILRALIKDNDVLRLSESFEDGEGLYELMKEKGFEGIVAKKKDSEYLEDDRSLQWFKIPIKRIDEFVIGGWAESDKAARSFRSILFGAYVEGKLKWVGRSGGGFKEKEMPEILKKLKQREIKGSPFSNAVLDTKGAVIHWVKPDLVGIFEYSEMTESGRIRKPATWKGFRLDKAPKQVVLPVAKEIPAKKKEGRPAPKKPAQ
jgi:bifunctional non-homologous end joining protein LigD